MSINCFGINDGNAVLCILIYSLNPAEHTVQINLHQDAVLSTTLRIFRNNHPPLQPQQYRQYNWVWDRPSEAKPYCLWQQTCCNLDDRAVGAPKRLVWTSLLLEVCVIPLSTCKLSIALYKFPCTAMQLVSAERLVGRSEPSTVE
jgi:hypothetical protein